jgi:hypothetical protein
MQILDKIDKKMDNKTESSRSGSHKSHNNRGRTMHSRSVGKHHQHSPRNSTRRMHNNSSPSPVRKPKKRTGVDEL